MSTIKLKSQGVAISPDKIDVEKGILYDAVMCQSGPAKGHNVSLEKQFIEDLVAFDNKVFTKLGVKTRFGHPAMCSDPLGTQAGKYYNVRLREVEVSQGVGKPRKKVMQAIGDLHLLEASNESPTHPNMRNYILKMAQEQPDFIMNSIVFTPGKEYQRNKLGEKVYVNTWNEDTSQWVYPSKELGDVYVEFLSHHYTDLVEAGAATDSLFSAQFNQESYAVQAIEWLNENPTIKQFIQSNPAKVVEFLTNCGIDISSYKNTNQMFENLKKHLGIGTDEDLKKVVEDADKKIGELSTTKDNLEKELSDAKEKHKKELADAQSKADELQKAKDDADAALSKANEELLELKKKAADNHTHGKGELGDVDDKGKNKMPLWEKYAQGFK